MKDIMKCNIYDCTDEIIIVGSCLKDVQPKAFEKLKNMNLPIFDLCLEQTHVNMAITKILGMVRAKKMKHIIFASVDRSPHCTQLHYIQDEIKKLGFSTKFTNYVAVDNELYEVPYEAITLSKNLNILKDLVKNKD